MKKNSYGFIGDQWFDGYVDNPIFQTPILGTIYPVVDIVEVAEYQYINSTCISESYYECLAKRFRQHSYTTVDWNRSNGSQCSSQDKCLPFSLPFDESIDIKLCENKIDESFYAAIIEELESSQEEHCKKTCTVQVFKTEEIGEGSYSSDGTFGLKYKFAESQSSRYRSTKPFKSVREEFWLISWTSLLGNVGGTLGMFLGFSFFTLTEAC